MAGNRSTLISLVHDANATLKIKAGGAEGDSNSLSKLRSILEITYTIANFGGWRALGMTSRSYITTTCFY